MSAVAERISGFEIAKYFLAQIDEESGDCLTNLKLQKLLYYAQGFHLAIYERPLFDEEIEAWHYGPVVKRVYQEYQKYSSNPIPIPDDLDFEAFRPEIRELLNEVYSVYGQFSAWKLRDMTREEAPWLEACNHPESSVISHRSLIDFFKTQLTE